MPGSPESVAWRGPVSQLLARVGLGVGRLAASPRVGSFTRAPAGDALWAVAVAKGQRARALANWPPGRKTASSV